MLRKVEDLLQPSAYVLNDAETEVLFTKCNSSNVKSAKADINKGARIVQVYNPNFTSGLLSGGNYFMYNIKTVVRHFFEDNYSDYWVLSFDLKSDHPVVYIVLRK